MNKIKLRVFAALSYIPFGIALLFFSTNILIRAMLILSVIPSAVVGLRSSQKNDVWEHLHFILDCWLQPWMRIEFALMGILSTLTLGTTAWLLVLSITVSLMPLAVWASKMWLFATFRADYEEEEYKTSLFRRRAS